MTTREIARLKSLGFGVGDAGDFLDLTDAERELLDLGLAVTQALRSARRKASLTQADLASRIGSTQPRIARIEAGAVGISLDSAFKALFAARGTLADVLKELKVIQKRGAALRVKLDKASAIPPNPSRRAAVRS